MESTITTKCTDLVPVVTKTDVSVSTVENEIIVVPWKADTNALFEKYQVEDKPDNRGRISLYIIEKAMKSKEYFDFVMQNHKTLDRCYKNITDRARKMAEKFSFAIVDDSIVYGWVDEYFALDDKAEIEEEERKKEEAKKKAEEAAKKKAAKKTTSKRGRKKKADPEEEKKEDNTSTGNSVSTSSDISSADSATEDNNKADTENNDEKSDNTSDIDSNVSNDENEAAPDLNDREVAKSLEAVSTEFVSSTNEIEEHPKEYQMSVNEFGQMSFIF